jgi:hypothetical protein
MLGALAVKYGFFLGIRLRDGPGAVQRLCSFHSSLADRESDFRWLTNESHFEASPVLRGIGTLGKVVGRSLCLLSIGAYCLRYGHHSPIWSLLYGLAGCGFGGFGAVIAYGPEKLKGMGRLEPAMERQLLFQIEASKVTTSLLTVCTLFSHHFDPYRASFRQFLSQKLPFISPEACRYPQIF